MDYIYILSVTCALIIGIVIGLIIEKNKIKGTEAGTLVIDEKDPNVDRYSFVMDKPFDELPKKKMVVLKIKVIST